MGAVADQAPSDIALVSKVKLYCICKGEGVQAFLMEWRDLHDPEIDWEAANLMGAAITTENIKVKPSNVVLPEKYSNFADVFDKTKANILSGHSRHDLAIKTENNKIPSFESIYNHSQLKLDILHEYIKDMYAKGFIVLFKSLSGAPILFTKKKNGGIKAICRLSGPKCYH